MWWSALVCCALGTSASTLVGEEVGGGEEGASHVSGLGRIPMN